MVFSNQSRSYYLARARLVYIALCEVRSQRLDEPQFKSLSVYLTENFPTLENACLIPARVTGEKGI